MGASRQLKILILSRLAIVLSGVLALSVLFSKLYFSNIHSDIERCLIGFAFEPETGKVTLNSTAVCRLGVAAVSLSILFATVLMAAESLIGYKSEEKQSFIIGNLVISALMGLLMFATLVYDSYGTIKSFESYTSKSKIAEHIVGGCVFLVAVGVSFLGWAATCWVGAVQAHRQIHSN